MAMASTLFRRFFVPPARCLRAILTPPGIGEPKYTIQEVIDNLNREAIGGPAAYDPVKYHIARQKLVDHMPTSQADLPAKRMFDSFNHCIIPLKHDKLLRDKYITHLNGVRVGRILENMDIFAVDLVYRHMAGASPSANKPPFSIVTALVDRIDIESKITTDEDLKLSGHITWVGTSSAEATLLLEQLKDDHWVRCIQATFMMVARDPMNSSKGYVNPLLLKTPQEHSWFDRGERNKLMRQSLAQESLFKTPPSLEEIDIIHDFFIQTIDNKAMSFKSRVKPANSVWMREAKLKSLGICTPDNRNPYYKIFGGLIMRKAMELAWATAYTFAKSNPVELHMGNNQFREPVHIGDLLYFNGQVCYTEKNLLQIRVSAEVVDPKKDIYKQTNVFHYTFEIPEVDEVRAIVPETYHEAMMYLDGRRHFKTATSGPLVEVHKPAGK